MKIKITILIATLFQFLQVGAQQYEMRFTYDERGNRITRQIIMLDVSLRTEAMADSLWEEEMPEAVAEAPQEIFTAEVGEQTVNVYPNPTKGKLVVGIENLQQETEGSVQIYDRAGRIVSQQTIASGTVEFDISDKAAGNYILKVSLGEFTNEWLIMKK